MDDQAPVAIRPGVARAEDSRAQAFREGTPDAAVDRTLLARIARLPRICGAVVVAIALTALVGWLLDVRVLKSIHPDMISMKANTALALALAGAALLLLDLRSTRGRRLLGLVCSALVALIGGLTLLEYAVSVDLGIDQLLFDDPDPSGLPPGRPAVNTALNLLLIGIALALLDWPSPRMRHAVQALTLVPFVIALLSFLGQAFGSHDYVGIGALDRMALNTAIAFLALPLGILAVRADSGWIALFSSRGAGGRLIRILLPVVVLLPALLGWLRLEGEARGTFDHTLGTALLSTMTIALFSALVIWLARRTDRIDLERLHSHAALAEREARLEEAQRLAQLGSWELDLRTNHLSWSDEIYRIFEIDPARFGASYDAFLAAIHPDDREAVNRAYQAAVANRTGYAIDHRLQMPDGRIKHVHEQGRTFYADDGTPLRSVGTVQDISARKQAELARAEGEQFLQFQIQRMPIGYIVWDAAFKVARWNPAAEAIFGYSAEQARGKHACELIVPGSIRPQIDAVWTRLLAGNETVHSINVNHTCDGREIVCDWTNAPLHREGKVIGVLSMVQDITEQRRAEEALQKSQALLTETQHLSRVGGWEYDVERQHLTWTEETYRIHGVERDYDPNSPQAAMSFYEPEHRMLLQHAFQDAIDSGEPYDLELEFRNARGDKLWVRTLGQAERRDGRTVRLFGNIMDITARKQAELAQARYADRLRAVNRLDHVISSTFDIGTVYDILIDEMKSLFLFDRTSLIVLSDDKSRWQIARHWTRGPAELQPRVWQEVPGSALEWIVQNRRTLQERDLGAEALWREDEALRKEGLRSRVVAPLVFRSELLGAITLNSRLPDAYGAEDVAIIEALADQIAVALNNTRLYEQLQQQAALLERRVRERTSQLESAIKDLEGFSYSVSHDLRAPLRAIDSFSDIILQDYADRLDAEGQRLFGIVRDNTAKMGKLIDDILAFSRAGRRELVLSDIDMNALVADVMEELRPQMADRAIEWRIAPLPHATGDRAALRQVLANLLSNAVKFTRGRTPAEIEVTAVEVDEQLVYNVRDNGAGFDPQYQSKLFGVFQRLHSNEEFEGTGIGLAIVKRIVEKHGGRSWADGRPGTGATFHFSLPRQAPGASPGVSHE